MSIWNQWKKGFDAWEGATAKLLEEVMKSPFVIGPSGTLMSTAMKMKSAADAAKASWWGELGLSTKRDQERVLHLLNQLQSKVMDLEEKLDSKSR